MAWENRLMRLSIRTKIAMTIFLVMILFSLSVFYIFEQNIPALSAPTTLRMVSALSVAAILAFALGYFISKRTVGGSARRMSRPSAAIFSA